MKLKKTAAVAAATLMAAGVAFAGVASATDGFNNLPAVGHARGTFVGSEKKSTVVAADGVALLAKKGPIEVRDAELTYPPLSYSGWHSHYGIVIAVVKEGTVTRWDSKCKPETFTAGQVMTEVGPHFVANEGATRAVLEITRIYPAKLEATTVGGRVDVPEGDLPAGCLANPSQVPGPPSPVTAP